MISLSVYFLGDNVNTRIFRNIINENINNKFTVIANEFENNIITAREEVEKLSFSLSAMYNNLNNRSREYLSFNLWRELIDIRLQIMNL